MRFLKWKIDTFKELFMDNIFLDDPSLWAHFRVKIDDTKRIQTRVSSTKLIIARLSGVSFTSKIKNKT